MAEIMTMTMICYIISGFIFTYVYPRIYQLTFIFIILLGVQQTAFSRSKLHGYSLQE